MNEKAEFAVKKLKEYARQQGFSTRNTSDLSTLEQWLIIELLRVEKLSIHNFSVSFPAKDEVSAEGYKIANDAGYNYRRVLKDQYHDIYYSGWMDCFDWISKRNER